VTTRAHARPAKEKQPLPPALPPAERTVGQLVAETIKLYGSRFRPALALGVAPATVVALGAWLHGPAQWAAVLSSGPVLLAATLVGATLVARPDADRRLVPAAWAAGVVAFAPPVASRIVVFPGIYLVALAWLGFVGLSVPAILVERLSLSRGLARGVALARADPVHAVGGLATLVLTIILTAFVLTFLLRGFGDQGLRVAALIAILVLAPLFFLGMTLLYEDQAARVRLGPPDSGGA